MSPRWNFNHLRRRSATPYPCLAGATSLAVLRIHAIVAPRKIAALRFVVVRASVGSWMEGKHERAVHGDLSGYTHFLRESEMLEQGLDRFDAREEKSKVGSPPQVSLIAFFAIAVGIFATCIAVYYSRQPLLELQAFRQTQTALTSYWMIEEGWQLPYQTLVLGYPWAVPFEFPIYQSIVALISWMGGFPRSRRSLSEFLFFACLCLARLWDRAAAGTAKGRGVGVLCPSLVESALSFLRKKLPDGNGRDFLLFCGYPLCS